MMNGPFVPIEDLSKHFSVSVSTIRAWVRQGHIPKDTYIKVGNTYRFSVADVSVALTKKDNAKSTDTTSTYVDTQVGELPAVATTAAIDIDEDL